ncbi:MAG: glycosyltransferase family 4 protein [Vicinamibacterales bacterium]
MNRPSAAGGTAVDARREILVILTTSFPRFEGDTVGTFMEPIARHLAARGHDVHVVLPFHTKLERRGREGCLTFHPFRYAPARSLNVFGYAEGLRADVRLRGAALLAAPLALVSGWAATRRVARAVGATVVHAHWVIPGGVIGRLSAGRRPLVISLHGSDVFVAEKHRTAGLAARYAFAGAGWVTACSDDLRDRAIALGARPDRIETVPYGVDAERFRPDPSLRRRVRQDLGLEADQPLVFTAGRFVRKKGFEYLVEAAAALIPKWPRMVLVIGGGGDLERELEERVVSLGIAAHVRFPGVLEHDQVAGHLAAADVAVVPSVRDDSGNVDGLPNVVMEALASGTPLVTTAAGGIGAVVEHGRTALVVAQRDPAGLACAIDALLGDPARRAELGRAARTDVAAKWTWERVAERFEAAYRLASKRAD